MQPDFLSSAAVVDDARRAAVFEDPLRRRLLMALVADERSIAELAAHAGLDLRRTHYHVTALAALGLVRVVRERARQGRAIKVYAAAARAFFVPASVSPQGPGARLSRELRDSLATCQRASRAGMLYRAGPDGTPEMRPVRHAPARLPAGTELWRVLRLSRSDVDALARELAACIARFEPTTRAPARACLVHVGIAPRGDAT